MESVRDGCEVHPAADIGTGHHRSRTGKALYSAAQQQRCEHCPDYGTGCADQEDQQEPSGLFPDLPDVGLQKQQRNRQRNSIAPDDIVKHRRAVRDHMRVHQYQRNHQCDDRPGYLRSPFIFLLQPDGDCRCCEKHSEKRPVVVSGYQGLDCLFHNEFLRSVSCRISSKMLYAAGCCSSSVMI